MKTKTTATSIRMTEKELDQIRTRASEDNLTIREVIMDAVRASFAKGKRDFNAEGYEQGRREGKKAAMREFRQALQVFWKQLGKT